MKILVIAVWLLFITGCTTMRQQAAEPRAEDPGSPDLEIQGFVPPIIMAPAGNTIYISDLVANIGHGRSGETTVRYYIADGPGIDIATATIIGERTLRSLPAKDNDQQLEQPFVIPHGLGTPPFFLAACVDTGNAVAEIHENNNCTTSAASTNSEQFGGAVMDGPAGVLQIEPIGVIQHADKLQQ